ncbi:cytochrome C oxidase subunit IV family protein [Hazenella sp. IB182357]|uniref:Cytochrome C oxidase subunit IV family protein n=1 Tax=Polycladospora coralii TaxID=2771432 RepID=A0A926NDG8_9BACL|nr:cytochrome C oxidase subunit IV family protein [Polycladospora coralii]MBD1373385.1 cytochrome C oxidase subunit IV family protein [Polycladospora coralii]MBS7531617.1 cytochrome C oxidase subunit IV family protein [Polycladospora coralii]
MTEEQQNSSPQQEESHKPDSTMKHIVSFAAMIVLTVAAFYIVMEDVVEPNMILPLLLFFASIQVVLQLFTFMHLNQKGTAYYTIFIFTGVIIAVVSAVGIILM